MDASTLFEMVLGQIEDKYADYQFFYERDIIWTLQKALGEQIRTLSLSFRVFHEYPFESGTGRPAMDIAIVDASRPYPVLVALELKYEPDHKRAGVDIRSDKFVAGKVRQPVFWNAQTRGGSVEQDVTRIDALVSSCKAEVGYALLIDEGGFHHKTRPPLPGCEWRQWHPTAGLVTPWIHWHKREG